MPVNSARLRFIIGLSAALFLLFFGTAPHLQAATLTVTNTDNAGAGSLRQAIIDANAASGADVIDFSSAATGTITLTSSLPSITGELDITGPGETTLSVSGDDVPGVRPFTIGGGAVVTISGLTVEKGNLRIPGGGIYNAGSLTLQNVTVRNNFGKAGGGIYSSGTLTLTNSTVNNNIARYGGGIYNDEGTLTLKNVAVLDNTARTQGGGIGSYGTLTLIDSDVSGNEAPTYSYWGMAGGIDTIGTTTLINSTVHHNTAHYGSGMRAGGTVTLTNSHVDYNDNDDPYSLAGAIFFVYGTLTLDDNSTVSYNSEVGISHPYSEMTLNGGTISNNRIGIGNSYHPEIEDDAVMTINGSTVSNNQLGVSNFIGGMVTINDTTVIDNVGLGIYNWQESTITLNRATVSGNGGNGIDNRNTLTLNNSTVSGNTGHGVLTVRTCRPSPAGDPCLATLAFMSSSSTVSGNGGSGISSVKMTGCCFPYSAEGRVELINTIIAGNGGDNCAYPSTITSHGHNLDSDGTCNLTAGDMPNTDPLLGPLQDNGGPTFTHALLSASPAINTGTCVDLDGNPVTTDQRGVVRPQSAACDIGAYEFETTPGVFAVGIDIKPGSSSNPINPNGKGKIPVAILSTPGFDATTELNKGSLTFGRTGDEDSLAKCGNSGEDVNGDGLLDIVCHFNTPDTGFQVGDAEGILKGHTVSGLPFEGTDPMRTVGR